MKKKKRAPKTSQGDSNKLPRGLERFSGDFLGAPTSPKSSPRDPQEAEWWERGRLNRLTSR